MYDYGSAQANVAHYNQTTPPPYDLRNMMTKVAVVYGTHDKLCSVADVNSYIGLIPSDKLVLRLELPYGHMDYVFANDAAQQLYEPIREAINKHRRQ